MGMHDHKLTIQTPEGVAFNLPLAGPVSRSFAWMIDAACIMVCFQIGRVVISLLGSISPNFSSAAAIMIFFLIRTGYAIMLEWFWQGQTVGKRVLRLRVMDVNGLQLQPSQIIIRNLLRAVDSLPVFYLVGGVVSLVNRHGQRLGDLAAGTIVAKSSPALEPDLDRILDPNPYNSLFAYPHLAARLRQHVVPEEAAIALRALMRRDELLPESRITLFEQIASHFKWKVEFPQEALDGVSDEQYVRNIVDVLFKSSEGPSSRVAGGSQY
jgi:uncharacterized RDD family membrane protein YckC